MSRQINCVCCPRGCAVTVDESGAVSGNGCRNGRAYALEQLGNPRRRVTGEIRVRGAAVERCPVKTDRPVPVDCLEEQEALLRATVVEAPVYVSQVLLRDVCGTGANVVSCASLSRCDNQN